MSRTYVVEADAVVRDAAGKLVREEQQRVDVDNIATVPRAVLDLVRRYWPEATAADIQWSKLPGQWDGRERIWWFTCAEIDGAVYRDEQMETPHG